MEVPMNLATLHSLGTREQAAVFVALVEALVETNRLYLSRFPQAAMMARTNVRYEPCPDGAWKDLLAMLRSGTGSCQDLVAARIAEHRQKGGDARVHVVFYESPGTDTFHMQVYVDGRLEDPARDAGML